MTENHTQADLSICAQELETCWGSGIRLGWITRGSPEHLLSSPGSASVTVDSVLGQAFLPCPPLFQTSSILTITLLSFFPSISNINAIMEFYWFIGPSLLYRTIPEPVSGAGTIEGAYLPGLSQVAVPGILGHRLVWSASDTWSGGNKGL